MISTMIYLHGGLFLLNSKNNLSSSQFSNIIVCSDHPVSNVGRWKILDNNRIVRRLWQTFIKSHIHAILLPKHTRIWLPTVTNIKVHFSTRLFTHSPNGHWQGDCLSNPRRDQGLLHPDGGRAGVRAGQATIRQAGEVVEVTATAGIVEWLTHAQFCVKSPSWVSLIT